MFNNTHDCNNEHQFFIKSFKKNQAHWFFKLVIVPGSKILKVKQLTHYIELINFLKHLNLGFLLQTLAFYPFISCFLLLFQKPISEFFLIFNYGLITNNYFCFPLEYANFPWSNCILCIHMLIVFINFSYYSMFNLPVLKRNLKSKRLKFHHSKLALIFFFRIRSQMIS